MSEVKINPVKKPQLKIDEAVTGSGQDVLIATQEGRKGIFPRGASKKEVESGMRETIAVDDDHLSEVLNGKP